MGRKMVYKMGDMTRYTMGRKIVYKMGDMI